MSQADIDKILLLDGMPPEAVSVKSEFMFTDVANVDTQYYVTRATYEVQKYAVDGSETAFRYPMKLFRPCSHVMWSGIEFSREMTQALSPGLPVFKSWMDFALDSEGWDNFEWSCQICGTIFQIENWSDGQVNLRVITDHGPQPAIKEFYDIALEEDPLFNYESNPFYVRDDSGEDGNNEATEESLERIIPEESLERIIPDN